MTSNTRKISLILLLLVVMTGGAFFYLASNLNSIVADIIETQGSRAIGTQVRVSGVDIRLTEASAAIAGLSVANPEGFAGNAIELGDFSVQLDAPSLTSDTIIIKDVTIKGSRINVVQTVSGNNLQKLLANMQADSAEPAPSADEGSKTVIIDQFILNGASASVEIPQLEETRELTLPSIVVRDIGRATNGATTAQVAKQVLKPVIEKAIATATAESLKDQAGKKITDAVGGLLKGLSSKDEKQD